MWPDFFVACSRVRHITDLLFSPPFPFHRLSNLSNSQRLRERQLHEEDHRLLSLQPYNEALHTDDTPSPSIPPMSPGIDEDYSQPIYMYQDWPLPSPFDNPLSCMMSGHLLLRLTFHLT